MATPPPGNLRRRHQTAAGVVVDDNHDGDDDDQQQHDSTNDVQQAIAMRQQQQQQRRVPSAAATNAARRPLTAIQLQQLQRQQQVQQQQQSSSTMIVMTFGSWVWLMIHAIGCGIFIAGLILQKDFTSSIECDMTYSQRQLIPIPFLSHETKANNNKYSLHKFVDRRDPRPHHKALLKEWLQTVKQTGNEEQIASQRYLQETNNKQRVSHCSPTNKIRDGDGSKNDETVAVLYIPGHWGSYMQSRSIGAHGIQLTNARDYKQVEQVTGALLQNEWDGTTATSVDKFQFDVYAINFQEEGAALHAQMLWTQTAFVAQAIQELVETCQLSQVVLLGHSIGGYVARLIPELYPNLRPHVPNIITLGSPHAHPVFGWESTVHQLHQTYLVVGKATKGEEEEEEVETSPDNNNHYALVSISGGLRDEMIPPLACEAPTTTNTSLSVLSPEIMKPGPRRIQPQLGMDHRAIVWCHNLLSVVRGVIYHLAKKDNQALSHADRLKAVRSYLELEHYEDEEEGEDADDADDDHYTNYRAALQRHQDKFWEMYGFVAATALEGTMLYHAELLVGIFVVLGCFQSIGTKFLGLGLLDLPLLPLVTTICLASGTNYQISWLGIVMLTLVANTIFWFLQKIFGVGLPYYLSLISRPKLSLRLQQIQFLCAGIFLLGLGGLCIGKLFDWQSRLCLAFLLAVYIGTIGTAAAIVADDPQSTRLSQFATTLAVACPFLVAGKIMALMMSSAGQVENLPSEYAPSWGLLLVTFKILVPTTLQLAFYHSIVAIRDETEETMRAMALTIAILYFGRSLFQMGEGYRIGDLLGVFCWLECIFLPVIK